MTSSIKSAQKRVSSSISSCLVLCKWRTDEKSANIVKTLVRHEIQGVIWFFDDLHFSVGGICIAFVFTSINHLFHVQANLMWNISSVRDALTGSLSGVIFLPEKVDSILIYFLSPNPKTLGRIHQLLFRGELLANERHSPDETDKISTFLRRN